MSIVRCRSYDAMSQEAAARVAAGARAKKDLRICAATGASPAGLYQEMVRQSRREPRLFDRLRVVKLDEWHGVSRADPVTCEHFLRERLLGPLAVTTDRYISFDSAAPDPAEECRRIRRELDRAGGIDICILGLGVNGHIGFNEPAEALEPWCHVATLSAATLSHPLLLGARAKPTQGMTLGIGDILAARKVLLLVSGRGKEPVIESLLRGKVSTELPASFMTLHADLEVFIDETR